MGAIVSRLHKLTNMCLMRNPSTHVHFVACVFIHLKKYTDKAL